MIEIFKDVYVSQWQHVLSRLQCDMFYFSMDGICYALPADGVRIYQELSSNQESSLCRLQHRDNRKVLCLGDLALNIVEKSALIGIHSFTEGQKVKKRVLEHHQK